MKTAIATLALLLVLAVGGGGWEIRALVRDNKANKTEISGLKTQISALTAFQTCISEAARNNDLDTDLQFFFEDFEAC